VNSKAVPAAAKVVVWQPMWDRFHMSCQTERYPDLPGSLSVGLMIPYP